MGFMIWQRFLLFGFLVRVGGITLTSFSTHVQLEARVAKTQIKLNVHNKNNCSEMLRVPLPIPLHARVTRTSMSLLESDCNITGVVKHLDSAQADFLEAESEGRSAGLVTTAKISYDTMLFNIEILLSPLANTFLEIEYMEVLQRKNGQMKFQFPFLPGPGVSVVKSIINISNIGDDEVTFTPPLSSLDGVTSETSYSDVNERNFQLVLKTEAVLENTSIPAVIRCAFKTPPLSNDGLVIVDNSGGVGYSFNPPSVSSDSIKRNILFVIDTSGSMKGARLAAAKKSFRALMPLISIEDNIGVTSFAANGIEESIGPFIGSSENKELAENFVQSLSAQGGTNLAEAITDGFEVLKSMSVDTNAINIFLILSDGHASVGEKNPSNIAMAASESNSFGAHVFALAISSDADLPLLLAISLENKGVALRVYDSDEDDIAAQIQELVSGEFGNVLLQDISLQLEAEGADYDVVTDTRSILASGSELNLYAQRIGNIGQSHRLSLTATGITGIGKSVSHNVMVDLVATDFGPVPVSGPNVQIVDSSIISYAFAIKKIEDLMTRYMALTANNSVSEASRILEIARETAINKNIVWEGLTALILQEDENCRKALQGVKQCAQAIQKGTEGNFDETIEEKASGGGYNDLGYIPKFRPELAGGPPSNAEPEDSEKDSHKNSLSSGEIIGIALGVLFIVTVGLVIKAKNRGKTVSEVLESSQSNRPDGSSCNTLPHQSDMYLTVTNATEI
eukprot:m.326442 g.326442  ORF g.326442 m.326442 type:complete len:739 (+) comp16558_c1_seq11:168-2384(+)